MLNPIEVIPNQINTIYPLLFTSQILTFPNPPASSLASTAFEWSDRLVHGNHPAMIIAIRVH